jgi:hypothetical protein
MRIGIVLVNKSRDMIYVDYKSSTRANLTTPVIPIIDTDVAAKALKSLTNPRILDTFVSKTYIPGEDIHIMICEDISLTPKFITSNNSRGFILVEILESNGMMNRFTDAEKNKIYSFLN